MGGSWNSPCRFAAAFVACAALCALVAAELVIFGPKLASPPLSTLPPVYSQARKREALRRLVRAAAAVCGALDECWLDSGTLLGARRDGRVMPWDEDGDVGLTRASLAQLDARHRNGSYRALFAANGLELRAVAPRKAGAERVDVACVLVCLSTDYYVDFFVFDEARGGRTTLDTRQTVQQQPQQQLRQQQQRRRLVTRRNASLTLARLLDVRGYCEAGPSYDKHLCRSGRGAPLDLWRYATDDASPGLLHGVWSHAWAHCERCLARPTKEPKRLVAVRQDWVLPTKPCVIEGVETRCPRRTRRLLEYNYGSTWVDPPVFHRVSTRVAAMATIVALLMFAVLSGQRTGLRRRAMIITQS